MHSHTSVLLQEATDYLKIKEGNVVLDATINGGGHSEHFLHALGEKGILIGIDLDQDALFEAKERLQDAKCTVILHEGNYRDFEEVLKKHNISKIDRALFDLGLSSRQLDISERGFSFRGDEPLTMTFRRDPYEEDFTAEMILNNWDEEDISNVLFGYGEEKFSRQIAHAIIANRKGAPIQRTSQLVAIIEDAVPFWYRRGKTHCATKTFQGLRIAVNDELGSLKEALAKIHSRMKEGGRIAVISFHSIEDRIVKEQFKIWQAGGKGTIVTKKPIVPSRDEQLRNSRSRSAKLRVFEK